MTKPSDKASGTKPSPARILRDILTFLAGLILAIGISILAIYVFIAIKGNSLTRTQDNLPAKVDCIIVPGASVYNNRTPSPMLQDRLDAAVFLYQQGVSDRILVSGDHREDNYNEPLVMYRYLMDQGIPDQAIFMDHYGLDTYDTIYRAKDVFQVQSAIIATQRFHLQRALFIANGLGLDIYGYRTDFRPYESNVYMHIREIGARLKAVYEVRTGALPLHESSPRPISGDGRHTRDPF